MNFLLKYAFFLLKTTTILIALLLFLFTLLGLIAKSKKDAKKGKLIIKKINDRFNEISENLQSEIQTKVELKSKKIAAKKKNRKKKQKEKTKKQPQRLFVIHFNGDINASSVSSLREEITAIILVAKTEDRVLCCLESPGGMVNAYGLAASQLRRIKEANLKLIIAVDKVAASGGYMMACVADEIIAAPFAVIGSIGVVAQIPNFHRYLEKKNIDFEQLTAGEYKRTLTFFGENTEQDRKKMQEEIDNTHELFKSFIIENRPNLDIKKVATGEYWYGRVARNLKLIDTIQTSDDYILSAKEDLDIFSIQYDLRKSIGEKMHETIQLVLSRLSKVEY